MAGTTAAPQLRAGRRRLAALPGSVFAILGVWVAGALSLSVLTGRVTNWFVMTDELVYERLAISIARSGSPVPRVHGTFVRSLDQLYPLLISPFFRHGTVASDLRDVHVFGAWAMSSALVPAFLLARRVTGRSSLAYLVAIASVATPWLIYSPFVLTETVAYPAFIWALFLMQRCLAAPSPGADVLALLSIVVAFLARTELVALAAALPIALIAQRLSLGVPRDRAALRSVATWLARTHPVLVATYVALLVAAAAYAATGGRLLGLSVYGQEIHGGLDPARLGQAFVAHLADLAFGLGILPLVVGLGWLLANVLGTTSREWHAFACLGSTVVAVVVIETARYDLGIGTVIYDRYLFYAVPIVLLGFACATIDRAPRWSLGIPAALVCLGFSVQLQAPFTWSTPPGAVDGDSPIAIYYHPFVKLAGSTGGARAVLAALTIAVTIGYALATRRVRRARLVGALLLVVVATGLAASTAYVFVRLFHSDFEAHPLTGPQPSSLGWVDQAVGPRAAVTEIPYDVSTDYLVSLDYWRNLEFWNKSVTRDAEFPSTEEFAGTGIWFPKLLLSVNERTGAVGGSPTTFVVQSVNESRFRIAGNVQVQTQQALLIDAPRPWRLSWMTFGLDDDGWLRPRAPARLRVFSLANQKGSRILDLSLQIQAPGGVIDRPFEVRTNLRDDRDTVSDGSTAFVNSLPVCVPAHGYADVTISASGESQIDPDLGGPPPSVSPTRLASVNLADTSVSDNVGPPCRAR